MILEERHTLPYHIQINSHLYGLAGTCYTDANKSMINFIHLVCNVVAFEGVSYDLSKITSDSQFHIRNRLREQPFAFEWMGSGRKGLLKIKNPGAWFSRQHNQDQG